MVVYQFLGRTWPKKSRVLAPLGRQSFRAASISKTQKKGQMGVDIPIEELRRLASQANHGARQSSAKRTSRLRVSLLIVGLVAVAALLGWQHRRDEVTELVGVWTSSLASLWPASLTNRPRLSVVEIPAIAAPQADTPSAEGAEKGAAQTAPPDRAASAGGDLQQQLQSIARELSVLRQNLEQLAAKQAQLAAKQEQMTQDIASFRTVKSDDKLTTASTPPSSGVPVPPRKKPVLLPPPPLDARPLYPEATSQPTSPALRR